MLHRGLDEEFSHPKTHVLCVLHKYWFYVYFNVDEAVGWCMVLDMVGDVLGLFLGVLCDLASCAFSE